MDKQTILKLKPLNKMALGMLELCKINTE